MVTGIGVEFDGGGVDKLRAIGYCLCGVLGGWPMAWSMSGGCDRVVVLWLEKESRNRRPYCRNTISAGGGRIGNLAPHDFPSNSAYRLCGDCEANGQNKSGIAGHGQNNRMNPYEHRPRDSCRHE